MIYQDWEQDVPVEIKRDTLWRMKAYRYALFGADLAWNDISKLMRDRRTMALSDQLYRAVGSIGANVAEGYSRSGGKDRAHFYEYALGSARESRDWYYKSRHLLGDEIVTHRIQLLAQIIQLLLTMVQDQRRVTLKEEPAAYGPPDRNLLNELLNNVPI